MCGQAEVCGLLHSRPLGFLIDCSICQFMAPPGLGMWQCQGIDVIQIRVGMTGSRGTQLGTMFETRGPVIKGALYVTTVAVGVFTGHNTKKLSRPKWR